MALERDVWAAVSRAIDELLRARGAGKSICPSEAARRVSPEAWRDLMPTVREVAAHRAEAGTLRITQRGTDVDARAARGPIRLSAPERP